MDESQNYRLTRVECLILQIVAEQAKEREDLQVHGITVNEIHGHLESVGRRVHWDTIRSILEEKLQDYVTSALVSIPRRGRYRAREGEEERKVPFWRLRPHAGVCIATHGTKVTIEDGVVVFLPPVHSSAEFIYRLTYVLRDYPETSILPVYVYATPALLNEVPWSVMREECHSLERVDVEE